MVVKEGAMGAGPHLRSIHHSGGLSGSHLPRRWAYSGPIQCGARASAVASVEQNTERQRDGCLQRVIFYENIEKSKS